MKKTYDLVIVGGGPGGYVAAIRAAQLGMKTVVLEKEHLGGTCLNIGCIPTKALYQSAEVANEVRDSSVYGIKSKIQSVDFTAVMKRKDEVVNRLVNGVTALLKKNKVDVEFGAVSFQSEKVLVNSTTGDTYEGKNILICTGSENALPPIPGLNGKNVLDSTQMLSMRIIPESLVIIGGGVIGCEFAFILNSLGCHVTVIEALPNLLGSMDCDCVDFVENQFRADGIEVLTETTVQKAEDGANGKKELHCSHKGTQISVEADFVLVATGRKACTELLNVDKTGLQMEKGFIQVNEKMETSNPDVYAAGDITGKSLLAHAASEGGVIAVENMNGINRVANFTNVPKVIFVGPEVASVGLTEQEAVEAGYDVICGRFNLTGNGKAIAMGKDKGFVKIVSEKKNHQILGMMMVGAGASELVTLFTQLLDLEAVLEDVEQSIYPHPAVAEAIREACLDALGRAVHK